MEASIESNNNNNTNAFTHDEDDHDWFYAKPENWPRLWIDIGAKEGDHLYICNTHKCNSFKLVPKKKTLWGERLRPRKEKVQ